MIFISLKMYFLQYQYMNFIYLHHASCFLAIPPPYRTVPKDETVHFLFISSTERRNQSSGVRPGQRRGSRRRCVLCRIHLSNSKTLPTRSWKRTHTETVRETDRDISQKWFGFTGSWGKLKPATQGNYIRRSLRIWSQAKIASNR